VVGWFLQGRAAAGAERSRRVAAAEFGAGGGVRRGGGVTAGLERPEPFGEAGGRVAGCLLAEAAGRGRTTSYILDPDFGPAFIKICTYGPWFARVWVNGHEWAKRQAIQAGVVFTALSNGFASCSDPGPLQTICDSFGPEHVQAFFDRWITQIPRHSRRRIAPPGIGGSSRRARSRHPAR
jgi:hypothetical protein